MASSFGRTSGDEWQSAKNPALHQTPSNVKCVSERSPRKLSSVIPSPKMAFAIVNFCRVDSILVGPPRTIETRKGIVPRSNSLSIPSQNGHHCSSSEPKLTDSSTNDGSTSVCDRLTSMSICSPLRVHLRNVGIVIRFCSAATMKGRCVNSPVPSLNWKARASRLEQCCNSRSV